jgi:hypothetical protein
LHLPRFPLPTSVLTPAHHYCRTPSPALSRIAPHLHPEPPCQSAPSLQPPRLIHTSPTPHNPSSRAHSSPRPPAPDTTSRASPSPGSPAHQHSQDLRPSIAPYDLTLPPGDPHPDCHSRLTNHATTRTHLNAHTHTHTHPHIQTGNDPHPRAQETALSPTSPPHHAPLNPGMTRSHRGPGVLVPVVHHHHRAPPRCLPLASRPAAAHRTPTPTTLITHRHYRTTASCDAPEQRRHPPPGSDPSKVPSLLPTPPTRPRSPAVMTSNLEVLGRARKTLS